MKTVLEVTLPFFAVIGCGYLAAWFGILGRSSRSGLNSFVFYFALPVLLFSVMSRARFEDGFSWGFLLAWCLVSVVLFVLGFGLARSVLKLNTPEATMHALAGIYGNTGYVGIPLVVVAFGPGASVPVILGLAVDLVLMLPFGMILIESARGPLGEGNLLRVLVRTAAAAARNPVTLSILAGTAVSTSGVELPAVALSFVSLLGAAAVPCALFALGSSLYGQPLRGATAEVGVIAAIKLVAHPLLVWYVMSAVFEVDELWRFAAVVAASMPVAATVFVLAQQYETYVVRASTAVAFTTLASIATITVVLVSLGAGAPQRLP